MPLALDATTVSADTTNVRLTGLTIEGGDFLYRLADGVYFDDELPVVTCDATFASGTFTTDSFRVEVDPECLDGLVVSGGGYGGEVVTGQGYGGIDVLTGPMAVEFVDLGTRAATWSSTLAAASTLIYEDRPYLDPDPYFDMELYVFDASKYPCDSVYLGVLPDGPDPAVYDGPSLECPELVSKDSLSGFPRTDRRIVASDAAVSDPVNGNFTQTVRGHIFEEPGNSFTEFGSIMTGVRLERGNDVIELLFPDAADDVGPGTDLGNAFLDIAVASNGDAVVATGYRGCCVLDLWLLADGLDGPILVGPLAGDFFQVNDDGFDIAGDTVVFSAQINPGSGSGPGSGELGPYWQDDLETCTWFPGCVRDTDEDVYAFDLSSFQVDWLSRNTQGRDSVSPTISADGQHVAFLSEVDFDGFEASEEAAPDSLAPDVDVFVRTRADDGSVPWRASRTPDLGVPAKDLDGALVHSDVSLSADGRFVAFVSNAENLANSTLDTPTVDDGSYTYLTDRNPDGNEFFDEPGDTSVVAVSDRSGRQTVATSVSPDGLTVGFADRSLDRSDASGQRVVYMRRDAAVDDGVGVSFTRRAPLVKPIIDAEATEVFTFGASTAEISTVGGWFGHLLGNDIAERFPEAGPSTPWHRIPARPVVSDPVDVASGDLVDTVVDLAPTGGNSLLALERTYSSSRPVVSVLGAGWSWNWADRLQVLPDRVVMWGADGHGMDWLDDGAGGYERPAEGLGSLTQEAGGFVYRALEGDELRFDAVGLLESVSRWSGESASIERDASDRIERVVADTGDFLSFTYDGDRIVAATASDGRTVDYSYDDTGLLVGVVAPRHERQYEYDPFGLLTQATDGTGVVLHVTTYDDAGRVVEQQLPHGEVTTFLYDDVARTTTVTDVATGEESVYTFDAQARLESITDPNGETSIAAWDADGQPLSTTNRTGHTISNQRDDDGRLLSVTDATRGTTTFAYDDAGRVVEVLEPNGARTTMSYDGDERFPSSVVDPLGATTEYDVVDGLVTRHRDADGVETTYEFDDRRLLTSMTNGLGHTWTYTYDDAGRLATEVSPLGNVWTWEHDDAGRLVRSISPDGAEMSYVYDAEGRLVSSTDPTGATITNTYDPTTGLLTSTTDQLGRTTSYEYDELAQLVAVETAGGSRTETDFGDLGRVVAERDPAGRQTEYAYDAIGNTSEVTGADGSTARAEYDGSGRITSTVDAIGETTLNSFDDLGRLDALEQPDGTTIEFEYDLLNRTIATTSADGGTSTIAYTPGGRVAAETDPTGVTMTYEYDDAGQLAVVTDANGNSVTYQYDADGRQTSTTSPEGLVTATEFDAAGRVVRTTDPSGITVDRTYSLRGELLTEQRSGEGVISYTYAADGTLSSVTNALGHTTTYGYDLEGRRTSRTDPLGNTESWVYNDAGEIVGHVDRLGRETTAAYDDLGRVVQISDASGRSTSFDFDAAGRLTTRTTAVGGETVEYRYDVLGRRTEMIDALGTTTYTYDAAGRPTSVASPAGTLSYQYDLAGRLTGQTYPNGDVETYGYDPAGRLVSVASPLGSTAYQLSPDGHLLGTTLPDGSQRAYQYTGGRLTSSDDLGIVRNFTYDAAGRLASVTGDANRTYVYDQGGQLVQATQDEGTYEYTYGPRGEITEIVDPTRTRTFSHNANSEIVEITDGQGATGAATYDDAGRLVEYDDPDGTTTTYTYDGQGQLESTTITAADHGGGGGEPAPDPCAGLVPTITGTEGDDVINGTWQDDVIFGLGGNDTITGASGSDTICGGDGDDTIHGQSQADTIFGGAGNDTITGADGADVIDGGPGDDVIQGDSQDDVIQGGDGDDDINGNSGADTLDGGNGNDVVDGSWQNDTCDDAEQAISCETITNNGEPPPPPPPPPDPPPPSGETTSTVTRTYDGDGVLVGIDETLSDGTTRSHALLWDATAAIPQVMTWTIDGTPRSISHVYARETVAGQPVPDDLIGDGQPFDSPGPFGAPIDGVGFGFRSELQVGPTVHLRNRDFDTNLGVFLTPDPLDGVDGTSVLGNSYHYADNAPTNLIDPLGLRSLDFTIDSFSVTEPCYGSGAPSRGGRVTPTCSTKFVYSSTGYILEVLETTKAGHRAPHVTHDITESWLEANGTPEDVRAARAYQACLSANSEYECPDATLLVAGYDDPSSFPGVRQRLCTEVFQCKESNVKQTSLWEDTELVLAVGGVTKLAYSGVRRGVASALKHFRPKGPVSTTAGAAIARHVTYTRIPRGFDDAAQFSSASQRFRAAIGSDDALIGVRGSAATGRSSKTGGPFHAESDIDFFVVSDDLFARALAKGAKPKDGAFRVGATQIYFPEIAAVEQAIGREIGRKATIRIYSSDGWARVRTGMEVIFG